jgi:hypothetical protein
VAPRISRSAEDREAAARQARKGRRKHKEEDMLFGTVNPAIRAAAGVVLLVIGVVLHSVVLDATGAAALVIGAVQWLHRRQGSQGPVR